MIRFGLRAIILKIPAVELDETQDMLTMGNRQGNYSPFRGVICWH